MPEEILEAAKIRAHKIIENSAEKAKAVMEDAQHDEAVAYEFRIHEKENQRRFEEQKSETDKLFVFTSNEIGKMNKVLDEEKIVHHNIQQDVGKIKDNINRINLDNAEMKTDIKWIKEKIGSNKEDDDKNVENLVSMDRFGPIEKIVYGFTAVVGTSIIGAIIAFILEQIITMLKIK